MKFIFSISILIISGVLFFTLVNPLYSQVKELKTDVATYNLALSNSKELANKQDDLARQYTNISLENRTRLERFLPNTANNIKFILEVERIANIHSMPIGDIKFTAPSATDQLKTNAITGTGTGAVIASNDPTASLPYGIFPIEFTTKGNYNNFVLFLQDLERNLRLVDIKSVNFSVPLGDVKGTDPNIYNFTIKIETYWLK